MGELIVSGMSDELIRDQLLTLLIAGHDTSTALLAWALYLLTTHPDVYARARDEVDRVLGGHAPTYHGIGQLTYLDCVIKETLRLYPPSIWGLVSPRQIYRSRSIPSPLGPV